MFRESLRQVQSPYILPNHGKLRHATQNGMTHFFLASLVIAALERRQWHLGFNDDDHDHGSHTPSMQGTSHEHPESFAELFYGPMITAAEVGKYKREPMIK